MCWLLMNISFLINIWHWAHSIGSSWNLPGYFHAYITENIKYKISNMNWTIIKEIKIDTQFILNWYFQFYAGWPNGHGKKNKGECYEHYIKIKSFINVEIELLYLWNICNNTCLLVGSKFIYDFYFCGRIRWSKKRKYFANL